MSGPQLTPRESAVLAAIERRLSNPEIAAELFLSVRTVESHIASLRRKLGASSRAELVDAAVGRRAASVRLPQNAFVGRDADRATLAVLLENHHWVTLTGPGGVGKTRLALEFADADTRVPLVVELEHSEPGDVVARLARVLRLEIAPGTDAASSVALALALAAQPYLLVLDNIDRVGPSVGDVVARATAAAPALRVLTTSRTPIGDASETVFPLSPLVASGADSAAVAMFLDRLGPSALPQPPSADDLERAALVCDRVDGLPLAIELAAAVARHLTLAELADRLSTDLAMLDRATPGGRHRTLETAFDWTWDLLDDDERETLCRLAALPNTFDIDLAVAVTHPGAEGVVLRLLDHSLLVPAGGHPRRFRLLSVLREFVRGRTDPAVIRGVLQRHAEVHAAGAAAHAARARTDDSREAMELSHRLCPEVNAALRWALAAGHPSALPLAVSLSVGVEQYGTDVDSIRAIALVADDGRALAAASAGDLLILAIALAFIDMPLVDSLAARAGAIADDPASRLAAVHLAGMADAYGDRVESAIRHLDEAEALAVALDDPWELASVRQSRGIALRSAADGTAAGAERAISEFEAAMHGFALAGDGMHVNNARYMMASTAAEAGIERRRAAEWAASCVEYAVAAGNEHELAHAALVQQTLGRADAALDLDELTGAFQHLGDVRCSVRVLLLRAERADGAERGRLLHTALGLADAAGDAAHQRSIRELLAAVDD
ncbi:hypothetical protein ASF62_12780 [Leifsonia sp. Leaf325]|nr:LuxR C-terminal-related transcriptional regulator [Leifsonia sp. Leaf325]KQQ92704.1 hypothetical protein ASF62_12780 [Leifsonia sp. Leaf325]